MDLRDRGTSDAATVEVVDDHGMVFHVILLIACGHHDVHHHRGHVAGVVHDHGPGVGGHIGGVPIVAADGVLV